MKYTAILMTAAALVGGQLSAAGEYQAGNIRIDQLRSPEPPPGAPTAAVYMTLVNQGAQSDSLVSASTEAADSATVHATVMSGDVMKMRHQDRVELPAGDEVRFEPGGLHVMLTGLHEMFGAHDSFPLTLSFESGGEVTVEVPVVPLGGGAGVDHGGHGQGKRPGVTGGHHGDHHGGQPH